MGIRYYAYAFNSSMTDNAIADPWSILSDDPFADAWGLETGAQVGVVTLEQTTPERDLLYLDKAWSLLQSFTAPTSGNPARPAFRMFEGQVTMQGYGWEPWVRVITPDEIPGIAQDLDNLSDDDVAPSLQRSTGWRSAPDSLSGADTDAHLANYAVEYLQRARDFVALLAAEDRGMVYLIG